MTNKCIYAPKELDVKANTKKCTPVPKNKDGWVYYQIIDGETETPKGWTDSLEEALNGKKPATKKEVKKKTTKKSSDNSK